ncbi:hypothetical protein [Aquipuribacter nitratireducens]|uniref:Uncharacterized protein n=1 Tax=Aquipuribacter nitratireducens TaxID=650104 RepID=A0ABW0GJ70_9MICO
MTTTPISLALDELATVVGELDLAVDGAHAPGLESVVLDLEAAAGASLGPTTGDPGVVLVRRFARAHRILGGLCPALLDDTTVRAHVATLRGRGGLPVPGGSRSLAASGV